MKRKTKKPRPPGLRSIIADWKNALESNALPVRPLERGSICNLLDRLTQQKRNAEYERDGVKTYRDFYSRQILEAIRRLREKPKQEVDASSAMVHHWTHDLTPAIDEILKKKEDLEAQLKAERLTCLETQMRLSLMAYRIRMVLGQQEKPTIVAETKEQVCAAAPALLDELIARTCRIAFRGA